jgi:hypothetical protein
MAEALSASFSGRFETEVTSRPINSSTLSFLRSAVDVGGSSALAMANKEVQATAHRGVR